MPQSRSTTFRRHQKNEMRDIWQNKRHTWNHRHTNKEELQQRNRLGTISRKLLEGLNQLYWRDISPLTLTQFQSTSICEIRIGVLYLISGVTKTCLFNFDILKPNFYIVKPGFTGVFINFLISAQKHRLWVLVRTAAARRF